MADFELVQKIRENTWKNPQLSNADLSYTDLQNSNLESAELQHADLRKTNLAGSNLKEAYLISANMQNSNLRRVNLEKGELRLAQLNSANLQNANLKGANLLDSNLSNAVLLNAVIAEADLERANLQSADLKGADLRYAQLNGANFQNAKLEGADFNEARLDRTTIIDLPDNFYVENGIVKRRKEFSNHQINVPNPSSVPEPAGELDISNEEIEKKGNHSSLNLHANPEDRIGYPDSNIPTGWTLRAKNNSLAKLEKLRDELDKFHGNDEEFVAQPNTEEMPLSKDDLEVLKQAVNVSITLHKLPNFPQEVINALRELMNYLKTIAQYLAGIKIKKVAYLVTAINQSWELIEKFLSSLE